MNKRSEIYLVLALILLNFLFRFSLISIGPYHSDTLFLALQGENILKTGTLHYLQGSGLPLTTLSAAGLIGVLKWFGLTDIILAVNLMSVVFSSLCMGALFLLVKGVFHRTTAFISILFLSLHPLFLALSTFGNSHPPAILFFVLGVSASLTYLKGAKRHGLILSGLCFGLMGSFRLQDFLIMIPALTCLFLFPPKTPSSSAEPLPFKRRMFMLISVFSIAFFMISLFYLPAIMGSTFAAGSMDQVVAENFFKHLVPFSPSRLIRVLSYFFAMFSPIEYLLAFVGIGLLLKKDPNLALFLLTWTFVPLLMFSHLIFYELRLTLISIIPLNLLAAYTLTVLYERKTIFRTLCVASLLLVLLNLMNFLPKIQFRHQHALLPEYFRWVHEVTESNAYIIEKDHSVWVSYYAKRKSLHPDIRLYGAAPQALENFKTQLDGLLSQDIPVYITGYGLAYGGFKDLMHNHYRLRYIGTRNTEDWRKGALFQIIIPNDLFRIEKIDPS